MSSPPPCPHRPHCPGCPRYGEGTLAPAAWDWLCRRAAEAGLTRPRLHDAPALGHRHRARLAVRGDSSDPRIGLFEAGSHRIVATPRCAIHHARINEAASALRESIGETGTIPYDDTTHRGVLRYVQLVVERSTDRVQVVLVGRGETPESLGDLPNALARRLGERLQGLFFNAQPARTNAILGDVTIALAGEPAARERIGGVDVYFPPTAFGQNHLPLFERAVERIGELVPESATVSELYCGVGAIGLSLLARGSRVRFNERARGGLEGLASGLAARPSAERARAEVFPGSAGDHRGLIEGADVVVVDPPRKGLDRPLLEALAGSPPPRLVYLACDRTSLDRDLDALLASGKAVLRGIEAFDFFPFTEHVETLVWLDRAGEQFAECSDPPPAEGRCP